MPQLLTARELAEELLKTPDAVVVFDDDTTEYLYCVELRAATKDSVSLTWNMSQGSGPFIKNSDGKLIEP